MHIIINTTNIQVGGGIQVSHSIINELKHIAKHHYHVFLSPQLERQLVLTDFPQNFTFYSFDKNPTANALELVYYRRRLHRLEKKIRPDFVLTIFGPALWKPRAPHLLGFAQCYFLYKRSDFIQKVLLTDVVEKLKYYPWRYSIMRATKREGTIWWIETQTGKEEFSKTLHIPPQKIHVVTNTYARQYDEAIMIPTSQLPERPFTFLYLASLYKQKNHQIFNRIIPILYHNNIHCKFLLTLPQEDFNGLFKDPVVLSMLENLGPLDPVDGPNAYNKAHALFFPSLLEVFSANYPEAMKMERPILTSGLPFARTVCGEAAHYFNPFEAEDVVKQIQYFIRHPEHRQNLVEKGKLQLQQFDTAYTRAEKLINIMEEYVAGK